MHNRSLNPKLRNGRQSNEKKPISPLQLPAIAEAPDGVGRQLPALAAQSRKAPAGLGTRFASVANTAVFRGFDFAVNCQSMNTTRKDMPCPKPCSPKVNQRRLHKKPLGDWDLGFRVEGPAWEICPSAADLFRIFFHSSELNRPEPRWRGHVDHFGAVHRTTQTRLNEVMSMSYVCSFIHLHTESTYMYVLNCPDDHMHVQCTCLQKHTRRRTDRRRERETERHTYAYIYTHGEMALVPIGITASATQKGLRRIPLAPETTFVYRLKQQIEERHRLHSVHCRYVSQASAAHISDL